MRVFLFCLDTGGLQATVEACISAVEGGDGEIEV